MIGNENCIIIGRCGNYIFRDRKDLISLFLKGGVEERIAAIVHEEHLSYEEAKEFVVHTDDCREAYHQYYTQLKWGNAQDYDLCLDSVRLGTEKTALLIEQYIHEINCR